MSGRENAITLHGNPLALCGPAVGVGTAAPDAALVDGKLADVTLSETIEGKVAVVISVPSLDTPVCDVETRRFNQEASALGDDVVVVAVSADLPFAQARWCSAAGVDRVTTLSDYRSRAFGKAYGILIQGLELLARAVYVVDREGTVRYVEEVGEIADEPDYGAALEAVRALV